MQNLKSAMQIIFLLCICIAIALVGLKLSRHIGFAYPPQSGFHILFLPICNVDGLRPYNRIVSYPPVEKHFYSKLKILLIHNLVVEIKHE